MHAGNSNILGCFVYVPVSTGALKGDKSLKMPYDSTSAESGGMPPHPLVLAYFACPCALHTMTVHIPVTPMHINNNDTFGGAPLFKSLDLPLLITHAN